jgi:hypothetical protein
VCFEVTISGTIKNKHQVTEYARDVLSSFFTRRFQRPVDVWIHFRRCLGSGVYGFCHGDKNEVWIDVAKGYTDLQTGTYIAYDYSTVLISLAHELVHAKQLIKGQLSSDGTVWTQTGKGVKEGTVYRHLPWEAEAHTLETRLYVKHWIDQKCH